MSRASHRGRQSDRRGHGRRRARARRAGHGHERASWATASVAVSHSRRSKIARSSSRCGRPRPRSRSAEATIRQREADLKLAQTNVERSRNLFGRQLLPKQTLDDCRSALHLRGRGARSVARAARAVRRPARGAAHQPGQHERGVAGRRLRVAGATRHRRVGVTERAGGVGRRHLVAASGRQRRRKGPAHGQHRRPRHRSKSMRIPARTSTAASHASSPVLDPATRTARDGSRNPEPAIPPEARDVRASRPHHRRQDATCWSSRRSRSSIPRASAASITPSEDNKAKFNPVKVGIEDNDNAEILEGLTRGRTSSCRTARARCAATISWSSPAPPGRAGRGSRGPRVARRSRPAPPLPADRAAAERPRPR